MNKYFLQESACILFVGSLSLLGVQTAHAQSSTAANFDFNAVRGNQTGPGSNFQIRTTLDGLAGPYIHLYPNTNGDNDQQGSINFICGYNPTNRRGLAQSFLLRNNGGSGFARAMQILQDGTVQIGDKFPTTQPDYKLSVQGKLVAQSVYVTAPNNWADFVFAPSYKLMTLSALENYLQHNKHLPYIPSAKEIETNGYSVTEMDAKLLQTMEELTLHVIELGTQNQQLQTRLAMLEKQMATQQENK